MQADNNKYKPEQQFTDRSWEEMRKMLDKEMPVEKRKRRGFFWIFLLLGVGIASAIWTFYPKKSEAIVKDQPQQILAKKTENTKAIIENDKVEKEIKDINPSIKKNKVYRKNKSTKTKNQNWKNNFVKKSEPIFVSEAVTKVESPVVISKVENNVSFEEESLPASIEQLFSVLEIEEEEESIPIVKACLPNEKNKISFGVFGGALMELSNKDELGFFSGLNVNFPLGKRFGIRTGVGYSLLKKNQAFNFSGEQAASVRSDFSFIDPNLEQLSVSSFTNFILEEMHYLDVPILLTYTPHRKIQFHLGAQGSYLIKDKVKSVENNLSLNQPVDLTVATTSYSLSTVDLSTVSFRQYADENFWNRMDISSVVGVAWKPTKWLRFELQYNRGWLKYLKTNQEGYFVESDQNNDQSSYSVSNSGSFSSTVTSANSEILNTRNINHSLRLGIGIDF